MKRITFIIVIVILGLSQISKATTPRLSEPRSFLVSTTIGDLAIFAGGFNATGYSDRVDIFNYTSNTWNITTLSQHRAYLSATTVGNLAIFAGGQNGSGYTDQVDIFNYTSSMWSTATLSQPRASLTAVTVGNLAIFAGGYNATGRSDRVDIYDYASNTWNTSTLSQPRYSLASTTLFELAIFAGGYSNTWSNRVDIYNYTSNSWNTSTLSEARFYLAATTVGDMALFAGGKSNTYFSQVDTYNYNSNNWNTSTLSQARANLAATTINNLALFAGGYLNTTYFDKVDIYNYSSNTWSTAVISQPRAYLAATTIGDLAIFAGGRNATGYSDQVDIYNITSNLWIPHTCLPGTYVDNGSTEFCSSCLEGTYSNVTNSAVCFNCSIGTYSNETGTIQCQKCPKGTYCQEEGCILCNVCPAGTFSGDTGANSPDTCQPCGAGFYSSEGSSQCTICPEGTTSKPGSSLCSKSEDNGGISQSAKIAIVVIAIIFGLALFGVMIALIRLFRRRQTGTDIKLELVDTGHWTVIENIEIGERLGGGNFGDVYKGIWNGTTTVALKKLKSSEHLAEFAKEADVLQSLNHPNIVRCLGIHTTSYGEQFIVMEYLSKGSVDVLLALEKESLTLIELLAMAKDAAAGMLYLEQQKIVHRDLALRNLLAASDQKEKYTAKVSDFGLSRQIKEEGFYMKPENTGIPIRWSAPEVLEKGVYTSKSDVWSFGVMLWELFSYGQIPYTGMTNAEVMQRVVAGHRLSCPEGCPQEVYELMGRCWHHRPEARPTFKQIYDKIKSIWNEHRSGNAEIVVDNSNIPSSNSDYGNRVVQQFLNSNFNNQVAQPSANNYNNRTSSNYNTQVVQLQNNSNYNNESINVQQFNNSNYN